MDPGCESVVSQGWLEEKGQWSFSEHTSAEAGPWSWWGEQGPEYSSSSPMVTPSWQSPTRAGDPVLL